ncbi:hypothetical protein T265_15736, partial [Opisthorchis viverrini]
MPPEESTKAEIPSGCPSQGRSSRDAEVGSEPSGQHAKSRQRRNFADYPASSPVLVDPTTATIRHLRANDCVAISKRVIDFEANKYELCTRMHSIYPKPPLVESAGSWNS